MTTRVAALRRFWHEHVVAGPRESRRLATQLGSYVYFGVQGGKAFDARVWKVWAP